VRVTVWGLPLGDQSGHHIHEYDYVIVRLTGGELAIAGADGSSAKFVTGMGDAYARSEGVEHNVWNLSDKELRFTEIELLRE